MFEPLGQYGLYVLVGQQQWNQNAIVFACRWAASTMSLALRNLAVSAQVVSTLTTTQQLNPIRLWVARSYTVFETTNVSTLFVTATNMSKLQTSMPDSQLVANNMRIGWGDAAAGMTGGTATEDPNAIAYVGLGLPGPMLTPGSGMPRTEMFDDEGGSRPLLLAQNEGFRVRWGSVTLTSGTIQIEIAMQWAELRAIP